MDNLTRLHTQEYLIEKYNMNAAITSINSPTIPHWHDYYELEIILSGEGTTVINGKNYHVSKGSLFFLTPTDFHYYMPYDNIRLINVAFSSSCIEFSNLTEILSSIGFITCNINDDLINYFSLMINTIRNEINSEEYLGKQYTVYLLYCILIVLFRINKNSNANEKLDSTVQNILYYINNHFKEQISLDTISEFTGYSTGYICRIFKAALNCTIKEYITNLRLTHAEQLLMYTNESISDIAYFCGFSSLSHFLNIFKQKHKISPRSFRKENKALNNIY